LAPLVRGEAHREPSREHRDHRGDVVFWSAAALLVAVSSPVVVRGAPFADDFPNCLDPQLKGLAETLAASRERLGAIRPAHLLEILLTTGVCRDLPFGLAIAIPLALTVLVGFLLRGLLRDLGVAGPWPELAGAIWLLQPLGTEAALWPAAMHIPLGLALALAALRLHMRGHLVWGTIAVIGACLSVEQVVLALPLAMWLTTPLPHRRRAVQATLAVTIVIIVAFVLWPGQDQRLQVGFVRRLTTLAEDPAFFLLFPAVGLGAQSVPLAVLWAFPLSIVVLVSAGVLGWIAGRRIIDPDRSSSERGLPLRRMMSALALVALLNIPVIFNVPREGSPRLFAPTWLALAGLAACLGSRVRWRRPTLLGAVGAVAVAGSVLSIAFSVWVRVESADFVRAASREIATRTVDGDVVAVCGVRRTVVHPAPRGAFAVHELIYDWAAAGAVRYYTGRRVQFVLSGELWGTPCPSPREIDLALQFDRLGQGRFG
jgi:heme/copper-type cytochrome/quinol oxidase subunit 4